MTFPGSRWDGPDGSNTYTISYDWLMDDLKDFGRIWTIKLGLPVEARIHEEPAASKYGESPRLVPQVGPDWFEIEVYVDGSQFGYFYGPDDFDGDPLDEADDYLRDYFGIE